MAILTISLFFSPFFPISALYTVLIVRNSGSISHAIYFVDMSSSLFHKVMPNKRPRRPIVSHPRHAEAKVKYSSQRGEYLIKVSYCS